MKVKKQQSQNQNAKPVPSNQDPLPGQAAELFSAIQAAQTKISALLAPTPLVLNGWLSQQLGCQVYLKLENMQPIGSFKIRGATHRILNLTAEERAKGVIAASAGNHAQGVAWGAQKLGVDATIVVPLSAPIVKIQNTQALGAKIILHGENYDEAYLHAKEISDKTGKIFVHAFDDPDVIAGQGTIGLELLGQLPDLDVVIGSVGGGGLMTGIGTVLKALRPGALIVGCQAAGAPSMLRSIREDRIVPYYKVETFADGIAVAKANERMMGLLKYCVDEWVEVDDDRIASAVHKLLEKGKTLAEGAGAIALGALELLVERRKDLSGKKVVLVISGGNIDVNVLARIIDIALIRAGRRIRLNVVLVDKPGSLARLTALLAKEGANVLQVIHDRNQPTAQIGQTEVELTLETRGKEHSKSLIEILKDHVLRLDVHS